VGDICAAIRWLLQPEPGADAVYLWAGGVSAVQAALAAALERKVSGLVLEEALISFESAVACRLPGYNHEIILPGVLKHFDLPRVYQALAPRSVKLINPLSGDKSPATENQIEKVFSQVVETYQALQAGGNWSVVTGLDPRRKAGIISSFLSTAYLSPNNQDG
jgi:hypothetical protein